MTDAVKAELLPDLTLQIWVFFIVTTLMHLLFMSSVLNQLKLTTVTTPRSLSDLMLYWLKLFLSLFWSVHVSSSNVCMIEISKHLSFWCVSTFNTSHPHTSNVSRFRRYISSHGASIQKTKLFLERESSRLMKRQAALQAHPAQGRATEETMINLEQVRGSLTC